MPFSSSLLDKLKSWCLFNSKYIIRYPAHYNLHILFFFSLFLLCCGPQWSSTPSWQHETQQCQSVESVCLEGEPQPQPRVKRGEHTETLEKSESAAMPNMLCSTKVKLSHICWQVFCPEFLHACAKSQQNGFSKLVLLKKDDEMAVSRSWPNSWRSLPLCKSIWLKGLFKYLK